MGVTSGKYGHLFVDVGMKEGYDGNCSCTHDKCKCRVMGPGNGWILHNFEVSSPVKHSRHKNY